MGTDNIDTEALVAEIFNDSREVIKAKVKEKLQQDIINSLYYATSRKLTEEAEKFVENELADEIQSILKESKSKMLEEMQAGFVKVGAQLSAALAAKALENLEIGSYRSQEILKKIFG